MEVDLENTEYDVVVLGTGVIETLLARFVCVYSPYLLEFFFNLSALSYAGKKVLHLDREPRYGGDWSSLNFKDFHDWVQKG